MIGSLSLLIGSLRLFIGRQPEIVTVIGSMHLPMKLFYLSIYSLHLLTCSVDLSTGSLAAGVLENFGTFFQLHHPADAHKMQTSHISQMLLLTPSSLLYSCAMYLKAQFQNKLNTHSSSASVIPLARPLFLSVALVSELDIIAATLADAFLNRHW